MKKLLLIPVVALSGCLAGSIPQSKINVAGTTFALPKNSRIGTLVIELPTTNGVVKFYATNCVWENSPDVLNSVTVHDVGVINAIGDQLQKAGAVAKGGAQ